MITNPASFAPGQHRLMLVVDSGFGIRNILRTQVLSTLMQEERLWLTLVTPVDDADFRQEFSLPRVIIEPLPSCPFASGYRWLRSLRKDLWAELSGVGTYRSNRARRPGYGARIALLRAVAALFYRNQPELLLARMARAAITPHRHGLHPLLARHRPHALFSVNLFSPDLCLETSAHLAGIPVATMIQSWDNPTTKGPLPFVPELVIVWNEILRQEMMALHGVAEQAIRLSGLPQADLYLDRRHLADRATFFRRLGLDPEKRLLVYTTGAKRLVTMDDRVVTLVVEAMRNNRFCLPCQLLIRLHPKDDLARFAHLQGVPGVHFQAPGQPAATMDNWNPSREDMYGLAEVMGHADVVLNIASTITLDAAAFDTPVVNIVFDGRDNLPWEDSCRRFYQFDHYRRVVATGGVAMAHDVEELVQQVNTYLLDASMHRQGRERIVREQFWRLDGLAGQRVAEQLLALLAGVAP